MQIGNFVYQTILVLVFSTLDGFLVSSSSPSVIQAPCRKLFMRNLDNETNTAWVALAGIYELVDNVSVNSYPVYQHEKYSFIRFFYDSTEKYLGIYHDKLMLVGATTRGWFRTTSLYSRPNPFAGIIIDWYFYDAVSRTYKLKGKTAIEPGCVDDRLTQCDSGELVINDIITITQSDQSIVKETSFRQVLGLYNDLRPVYSTIISNPSVYLFHKDNHWLMGFNYTQPFAFAAVMDSAQRPELITHDWYFYNATVARWVLNATFKMTCKG